MPVAAIGGAVGGVAALAIIAAVVVIYAHAKSKATRVTAELIQMRPSSAATTPANLAAMYHAA